MFPPPQFDEQGRPIRLISPVAGMSQMSPAQMHPYQIPEPPTANVMYHPTVSQQPAIGSTNQPDFSPRNIPIPVASQGERNIDAMQPINPQDYKHHGMRKLADVLGTIGMGLVMGPGGAIAGHELFANSDVRKARNQREEDIDLEQTKQKMEDRRFKQGLESAQLGERIGSAQSLSNKREFDALRDDRKVTNTEKNTDSLVNRRTSLVSFDEWKKQNQDKIHPNSDITFAKWYMNLSPEEQKQVDTAEAAKHPRTDPGEAETKRLEAQDTPLGRRVNADKAAGAAGGRIAGSSSPTALEGTKKIETFKLEAKTEPEMIKRQADLTRAKSFATLTTNEKDTIRGSQVALQAFPDIREQLSTASDKIFGNRWNDFMVGKIGKDPEFVPLRTNIGMLQTLTAKLHVGSRGSVHILNHFVDLFNAKTMSREDLSESLDALEKWLIRYSKAPAGTHVYDVPDEVPDNMTPSGHTYEVKK